MEKSFLEELKKEIEFSSNNKWNNSNNSNIIRYLNIDNLRSQVLSTNNTFMQKDANGKFDPNTVRVITDEEKEALIKMMDENNYPLTARMYNFLLKSYIDGRMELELKEPNRKL